MSHAAPQSAWVLYRRFIGESLPAGFFDDVFLDDRNQDEEKGEESNEIEEWASLVGTSGESQGGAIDAFDQKRSSSRINCVTSFEIESRMMR